MTTAMPERPDVDAAFAFGPFRLIPNQQLLIREGGRAVKLGGRALDILHFLIARAGAEVSKKDLIAFAWPGVFVDEHNLKVHVSSLRRALGDTLPVPTYIATVVGRGYQFVGHVHRERIAISDFAAMDVDVERTLPPCPILIGRQRDIEGVTRALDFARLVTLVGSGGVGKTALATAVAHAKRSAFPEGVHFADLSVVNDHALVPHVVARCLGIQGDPPDLLSAMVEHLRDRRILIIIDNCEHVLPAAVMIATRLVEAKVNSCLLATSREPLGVRTENVQRVQPLASPREDLVQGVSEASVYPSVELFLLRAFEAVGYRPTDTEAPVIAGICEALDGLPLAIEIAAAKLDQFSPVELLHSVRQDIRALRNNGTGVHSRHQTLWATFDWSYRLLSLEEAAVFRLLSVFTGSFELSDVSHMARLLGYDPYQTTIALGGLVSRSLLAAMIRDDQLCYRMLDGVRSYAAEALLRDTIAGEADRHYAQLMLAVMERSQLEWGSVESSTWRARYGKRSEDLRKALDWCFSDAGDKVAGVNLTVATIRFRDEQSFISEQLSQVERAFSHCGSGNDWAQRRAALTMSRAFSMTYTRRPGAQKEDAWNVAVRYGELSGEISRHVAALHGKAVFLTWAGRLEEASSLSVDIVRIASEADNRTMLLEARRLSCFVEIFHGDPVSARTKLEQLAQDVAPDGRQSKYVRYRAHSDVSLHGWLAFSIWLTGQSERAFEIVEELVSKTALADELVAQSKILTAVALPIAFWGGNLDALIRFADMLRWNIENRNMSVFELDHDFYASAIRHLQGDPCAVDKMREAIDGLVQDGLLFRIPIYVSAFAEALLDRGKVTEAGEAIESALTLQRQSSETWCLPELRRVKAHALAASGRQDDAQAMLVRARDNASSIGARSFESRILKDMGPSSLSDRATQPPP